MDTYTKEKWYVEGGAIYAQKGDKVASIAKADRNEWGIAPNTSPVERDENMKRIVACVNFCAGFSNAELAEMHKLSGLTMALDIANDHVNKLLRQIDELNNTIAKLEGE